MAKLNSQKQIRIGAVISYIAIGLNIVSGLIYTPWMIHQIGDSNYGLYTLATSIISMFTIDFGMSSAIARFISKYRAEEKEERINSFLGMIYKLYILIDAFLLLALVFVYIFIDRFASGLTPAELPRFKIVFIIAATYSVISFPFVTFNGILTSYERFIEMKLCDMLNKIITIVITVAALLGGLGLYALVIINVSCNLITLVFKYYFIKRTTPIKVKFGKIKKESFLEVFGFSMWSTVVSIAKRFLQNIMPTIMSIVTSTTAITIYGIGSVIESYAYLIVSAITGMFMPKISRITADENKEERLNRLMCRVGRYQYFVIGLVFVGFVVVGKSFISLCYGKSRIDAYYVGVIMVLPQVFYAPQQIAQTTVSVENKVKDQAIVHIIAALLNIAIAFPLTKAFGAIGAAISICIIYFVRMAIMNYIYHTKLHINMLSFYKECYLKMAPPIILTIFIGLAMNFFVFNRYSSGVLGWASFFTEAVLIVLIYSLLMWVISFNEYEKGLVSGVLNKIRRK